MECHRSVWPTSKLTARHQTPTLSDTPLQLTPNSTRSVESQSIEKGCSFTLNVNVFVNVDKYCLALGKYCLP